MNDLIISADCHVDLIWLPPDLFTANASAELKERMPHVIDSDEGPLWVSKKGARFGLQNGMGSAGRKYEPGVIHRADRMAATGLYEDGARGIRRLTDPDLRIRDQDLDGVRGEVLYGILGASQRLQDPEAATEVMRIYNGPGMTTLNDFARYFFIPPGPVTANLAVTVLPSANFSVTGALSPIFICGFMHMI